MSDPEKAVIAKALAWQAQREAWAKITGGASKEDWRRQGDAERELTEAVLALRSATP